jgi:hypothetical protein
MLLPLLLLLFSLHVCCYYSIFYFSAGLCGGRRPFRLRNFHAVTAGTAQSQQQRRGREPHSS